MEDARTNPSRREEGETVMEDAITNPNRKEEGEEAVMEDLDPFSFDQKCGKISLSEEVIFRQPCDSSPADNIFLSTSSGDEGGGGGGRRAVDPHRISDYPDGVFMRSVSDSSTSGGDSGGRDVIRLDNDQEQQHHTEEEEPQEKSPVVEEHPDVQEGGGEKDGRLVREKDDHLEGGAKLRNPKRGRKKIRAAKKKCRPVKVAPSSSGESTQEPEGGSSTVYHDGGSGVQEVSPVVHSPSCKFPVKGSSSMPAAEGDQTDGDEFAKFRYVNSGVPPPRFPPLKLLKDAIGITKPVGEAALGLQKLPPSNQCPVDQCPADGEGKVGGAGTSTRVPTPPAGNQTPKTGADVHAPSLPPAGRSLQKEAMEMVFPGNLLDVVMAFSKELSEDIEEDVDILEVAESKGIHFPSPRWWRPGGYDPPKKK